MYRSQKKCGYLSLSVVKKRPKPTAPPLELPSGARSKGAAPPTIRPESVGTPRHSVFHYSMTGLKVQPFFPVSPWNKRWKKLPEFERFACPAAFFVPSIPRAGRRGRDGPSGPSLFLGCAARPPPRRRAPHFMYFASRRMTSSTSMGLATWAFMPQSRARFTSSAKASAVMAMMGRSRSGLSKPRMTWVAS